MTDLVKLARVRVTAGVSTHWDGCERDHRECLIQRMADHIECDEALLRQALKTIDSLADSVRKTYSVGLGVDEVMTIAALRERLGEKQ